TLGRKTGMAISGLLLVGFAITHLLGNLTLLKSHEAFNAYAQKLEDLGPLLTLAEVGLLALFLFHIVLALLVTMRSKSARDVAYRVSASTGQKTIGSSTMRVSGLLLLVFLIIHILDFRFKKLMGYEGSEDLAKLVHDRITSPVGLGIYVTAALLLGFHLSHGFKSAFQTLGLRHPKFTGTIQCLGWVLAIGLALGFALIPVALLLGAGGAK
ncbi:MAG TPA: succinate dehydrogenase cytochrome b subunit, partial [Planctomycetota bacterium]|nr:succinate dehydrogenase cytochrome b subunit [Planctomycetota bacterium]